MLNDLWEYWETLRAGRAAPYRSEIDPRQFERALGNMFILERVTAGSTRFRLAGMKFCDLVGMEVRGMPPGALIADGTVGSLDQTIDMVLDEPLVADLTIDVIAADGARFQTGMLLLPLKSDLGDVNRVLGCLADVRGRATSPVRFSVSSRRVTRIVHVEAHAAEATGFGEEGQASFDGPPRLTSIEGGSTGPRKRSGASLRVVASKD